MLAFLVFLLILCIVFGLLYYAVSLLPLPQPFLNIVIIILILIFVIFLLAAVTGSVPMPKWPG